MSSVVEPLKEIKVEEVKTPKASEKHASFPHPPKKDEDDFIIYLNWIALIKKGEDMELGLVGQHYFFTPNVFSYFFDYQTQEFKERNIEWIKGIVKRGLKHLRNVTYDKKAQKHKLSEIQSALTRCSAGLENLKSAYKSDRLFICKIDNLIESIKTSLGMEIVPVQE